MPSMLWDHHKAQDQVLHDTQAGIMNDNMPSMLWDHHGTKCCMIHKLVLWMITCLACYEIIMHHNANGSLAVSSIQVCTFWLANHTSSSDGMLDGRLWLEIRRETWSKANVRIHYQLITSRVIHFMLHGLAGGIEQCTIVFHNCKLLPLVLTPILYSKQLIHVFVACVALSYQETNQKNNAAQLTTYFSFMASHFALQKQTGEKYVIFHMRMISDLQLLKSPYMTNLVLYYMNLTFDHNT